jgi:hypothetical protein
MLPFMMLIWYAGGDPDEVKVTLAVADVMVAPADGDVMVGAVGGVPIEKNAEGDQPELVHEPLMLVCTWQAIS